MKDLSNAKECRIMIDHEANRMYLYVGCKCYMLSETNDPMKETEPYDPSSDEAFMEEANRYYEEHIAYYPDKTYTNYVFSQK